MINNVLRTTIISILSITVLVAQPKITVIPGTSLDLGDMYKGQKVEKLVTVKNTGTDTLYITNVKAQCGCTATMMTQQSLGTNDSGQLSIIFDSQNLSGRVTKEVYVSSNDTTNPKVTLRFSANVIEVLHLVPAYFTFNNAKVDSTSIITMTITNPSKDKGIKILSVDTKIEGLKTSLMKNSLLPGEQTQLQAVFKPTKPGTNQGFIELTTDHPQQKTFQIKVISWVNRK